jgi:hypothetical protein
MQPDLYSLWTRTNELHLLYWYPSILIPVPGLQRLLRTSQSVILISGTIWCSLWTHNHQDQLVCVYSWYPGRSDPASGPQITWDPDIRDDLIQPLDCRLPVILISGTIWSSLWTTDYLWSWYPGRSDPASGPQITCDPDIRDDLIQPQDRRLPVILISGTIWSSLWIADYLWSLYPGWSDPASGSQITCDPYIQDDLILPLDRKLPVIRISGTIWSSLWIADYLWSLYPGRSDPSSGPQITCDPDIRDDLIQLLNSRLPVILKSRTIWSSLWNADYLWSWYPGRSDPS